jgi:tetratricopeptide (TPR) repeat protein
MYIGSIITPLELHQRIKNKVFTKEDIKQVQAKLNESGIPYKDLFNELNWISEKETESLKLEIIKTIQIISGVRKEFENSEVHLEIYDKYIAPSIVESLSFKSSNTKNDMRNLINNQLVKGVIYPLHFDRILMLESKINLNNRVLRNIEIKERLQPLNLEPNSFDKIDVILQRLSKDNLVGPTDISADEQNILEILNSDANLKGRYVELKSSYVLGLSYFKLGALDKAEYYFEKLLNTRSDISSVTIATDFLKSIGELFENNNNIKEALYWYTKAIEYSPKIGLKKRIKELESIL